MYSKKDKILWTMVLASIPLLFIFIQPLSQNVHYHNFADQRVICNVPHFWNVISNIFFLIVALFGLQTWKNKYHNDLSWLAFILGVLLVAPGSAYYHYNPNNATLVWDRLPMSIGFMGLFSFVIKSLYPKIKEKLLLFPLLILGLFSVILWGMTDDLRLYYWVQFTPIILIIVFSALYELKTINKKLLISALLFYILAKVFETYDYQVFEAIGHSGHSIKHYLAAFAVYLLLIMRR